jgi:hypothetical protein
MSVAAVILAFYLWTLSRSSADELAVGNAGKTPEGTLRAYYYKYKGLRTKMRPLIARDSLAIVQKKDGGLMSSLAIGPLGMVVDHKEVSEDEATIYHRT